MKNAVSFALFAYALTWCTSVLCEERALEPGVVNDWMRATEVSESNDAELKRIVSIERMSDWQKSVNSFHVRYEVTNSTCKRSLVFYLTDEHGQSYHSDWVKRIQDDGQQESMPLKNPRVLINTYRHHEVISENSIMDLNVEYQVRNGLPVLVASQPQDVVRTLRKFSADDYARIRLIAFETHATFRLNLEGFADKANWSNEHCPIDSTKSNSKKEVPAS